MDKADLGSFSMNAHPPIPFFSDFTKFSTQPAVRIATESGGSSTAS